MRKIQAPTLRSLRSGARAPRPNPCGCQHAPPQPTPRSARRNPEGDRPLAFRIGRQTIDFNAPHNPRGVLLEQVFSAMLNNLRIFHSTDMSEMDALENVSTLAQFYLDAWVTIEDTTPAERMAMFKKENWLAIDPSPLYEQGFDLLPFRHACAEALHLRGGTIPAESAASLLYMDAVIRALPWDAEVEDKMRAALRALWKNEPLMVAELTGIHCAYKLGAALADEYTLPGIGTGDFGQIRAPKGKVNEELKADTREYLHRNPTKLEQEQAFRSYQIHQNAAVPFINNRNNPAFLDKIQPFA